MQWAWDGAGPKCEQECGNSHELKENSLNWAAKEGRLFQEKAYNRQRLAFQENQKTNQYFPNFSLQVHFHIYFTLSLLPHKTILSRLILENVNKLDLKRKLYTITTINYIICYKQKQTFKIKATGTH